MQGTMIAFNAKKVFINNTSIVSISYFHPDPCLLPSQVLAIKNAGLKIFQQKQIYFPGFAIYQVVQG